MVSNNPFGSVSDEDMVRFISSMFSELNVGMLIYRLEDAEDAASLRLIYANPMASSYTKTDLTDVIGLPIGEAFPALKETDLPEQFAEVVRSKKSRNIGAFEYPGDEKVSHGHYSVKVFPIPGHLVGIVFENITLQKQLHELVKKQIRKGGSE
jgi:hypothetical protein